MIPRQRQALRRSKLRFLRSRLPNKYVNQDLKKEAQKVNNILLASSARVGRKVAGGKKLFEEKRWSINLPVFRASLSEIIISVVIETTPDTMSTLSIKSCKAPQNFAQKPSATGFFATLEPKNSLRSGKSEPVRPLLISTLIFSQRPSSPK